VTSVTHGIGRFVALIKQGSVSQEVIRRPWVMKFGVAIGAEAIHQARAVYAGNVFQVGHRSFEKRGSVSDGRAT